MPDTRLEALGAASGARAPAGSAPLIREIGQSLALLTLTGLSVGGALSVVVVAAHALGR